MNIAVQKNDNSSKRGAAIAPRHFLDIDEMKPADLRAIIDLAHEMKKLPKGRLPEGLKALAPLSVLAMIFEKPSTRTRLSFDMAMRQLGGETTILNANDMQLGHGETIADTARVLSRFVDSVMIRCKSHADLKELAAHADIPVINGLTDHSHPCQIMADIQTFEENIGPIKGRTLAWIGDGNNVATSWLHAAQQFGFSLNLACPGTLAPDDKLLRQIKKNGGSFTLSDDPARAVKDCNAVITDTWVSMGDDDANARKKMLSPYQVDAKLMKKAADNAIFMHCLPAHREEEVTSEVIDGPQSVVFDEAENRLHAQKAILAWCLGMV